ncbi:MAG: hypothetical protein ACTSU5_17960 [Promethearchaeota archaeon]
MPKYAMPLAQWREDLAREEGDEPGRPGEPPDSPFRFAALPRVARGIPWGQSGGELGVCCEPCGPPVPSHTTLHHRCAAVSLEPLPRRVVRGEGAPRGESRGGGGGPVAVAVDSTGLEVSGTVRDTRGPSATPRTTWRGPSSTRRSTRRPASSSPG